MRSRSKSFFSDLPLDTPPLSPPRSPSSTSATRSSIASSSSSISLGNFSTRMSNANLEHPFSHDVTESVDSRFTSRKFAHDSTIYSGAREKDIQEELDVDMIQEDIQDRGRSGYDGRYLNQTGVPDRPSMPRQGSYSKRHASFDTPREVPFPYGYLSSSGNSLSGQAVSSKELQHHRSGSVPVVSQQPLQQSTAQSGTDADSSLNDSSDGKDCGSPPPRRPGSGRVSSNSLPLPSSMPYSSLPRMASSGSPPRYENPRPAPMIPTYSTSSLESRVRSPAGSPPRNPSLKPPLINMETRSPPDRFREGSPSPPLLLDENEAYGPISPQFSRMASANDSKTHHSLPLPQKSSFLAFTSPSSSRPTSVPHGLGSSILPPQPPTILTPPLPSSATEEEARKRAPYEPFLPRGQPSAAHTYIAVETVATEYRLIVRLPGFQRDAMFVMSSKSVSAS